MTANLRDTSPAKLYRHGFMNGPIWPDSVIKKMNGRKSARFTKSVAVLQFFFNKVNYIFTRCYTNRLAGKKTDFREIRFLILKNK